MEPLTPQEEKELETLRKKWSDREDEIERMTIASLTDEDLSEESLNNADKILGEAMAKMEDEHDARNLEMLKSIPTPKES